MNIHHLVGSKVPGLLPGYAIAIISDAIVLLTVAMAMYILIYLPIDILVF